MSRPLQVLWKLLFAILLLLAVSYWAMFVNGCSSAVVPRPVAAVEIAFEGNEQNAGVLALSDAGAVITERKKAEYDALVAKYGRGTETYAIYPPVKKGRGLRRISGKDAGFPDHGWVWTIDREHLTWFITFRGWERAARVPK